MARVRHADALLLEPQGGGVLLERRDREACLGNRWGDFMMKACLLCLLASASDLEFSLNSQYRSPMFG